MNEVNIVLKISQGKETTLKDHIDYLRELSNFIIDIFEVHTNVEKEVDHVKFLGYVIKNTILFVS